MRRNSAKLTSPHKLWLYSVTLLVYLTGVAWAWLHYVVHGPGDFGVQIHPAEPWMLRLHGVGAMVILVLLGTLLPEHVRFAWHARRNRVAGLALIVFFVFLVLTGYALYYLGDEYLRSRTSWLHLAAGIALPAMIILHIWSGRRSSPQVVSQRKEQTKLAKTANNL
jgi:surface polysaccharide O-acyltransferase-like enzyme